MRSTNQPNMQRQEPRGQQQTMTGRAIPGPEEAYAHVGDTEPMPNYQHDLVHELSDRIDAIWRYDQYIANADGKPDMQEFWRGVKQHDLQTVQRLKELIAGEVQQGCF